MSSQLSIFDISNRYSETENRELRYVLYSDIPNYLNFEMEKIDNLFTGNERYCCLFVLAQEKLPADVCVLLYVAI